MTFSFTLRNTLTHTFSRGKLWHFILAWRETQSREQGKIRTLAACFFLSICACVCVRGSSRYISRFLFCLLCVFPLGPRAKTIFSRSPFFNTCLEHDAQAEPVNTAEFTHPWCLTRIFIIVRCFACRHLWPYILINGSQMSFTKRTKARQQHLRFFFFCISGEYSEFYS